MDVSRSAGQTPHHVSLSYHGAKHEEVDNLSNAEQSKRQQPQDSGTGSPCVKTVEPANQKKSTTP
jgi:hypothetical protein